MPDTGDLLLTDARKRLLLAYPEQLRTALAALSDEQLWWRPNPGANSVGNLVLHLVGSTRHFLGRGVGALDYQRDRPAEFAEQGPLPRAELERMLAETIRESERVLGGLTAERLLEVSDRAGEVQTLATLVLRVVHHWSAHVAQILYVAKALKQGPFDDLWMKTMR
jgi:uncharacterized damage-inducible protein DinB